MFYNQKFRFWFEAVQCLFGSLGIALITLVCFHLRLQIQTATLLFLVVIVLLSLRGTFISAAVVSFLAVGCLIYYFAPPLFSFKVGEPIDIVAIVVFLTTSGVITHLVSRVRQLMQEKLERTEAYLSEAQQISHTGSFGWRVATGEILWSEETFRIFQYAPTIKPTMELVFQRVHPEDIAFVRQTIEHVAKAGKDWHLEYRLLLPDGEVKHLYIDCRAGSDGSGRLEFVGAVMDITERKRADEALRKAQANLAHVTRLTTVGELTASIAHEVNQPLAAVVMNANTCLRWLDRNPPDLDEARAATRRIVRDGNRGSDIIARIRGMLKKEPPTRVRLNVNDVIQEVIALARMDLHGVALQTDLADSLAEVTADRVQLQQVLLNLTVNAIDAMKPVTDRPRALLIRTRNHDERTVLVAVQDSGVGLDAKQMEQIFETFYTTKPEGLGMGLSICRSIIEGHGGRLWAEPNQGPGATFQFTLPIANGGAV
jgi:C4-dicarboxylate-specific signal transduction histidine kinase